MSRRSFFRPNLFITVVVFVVAILLAAAWLVNKYPWPLLHSDLSVARESTFVGHWPQPALDDDKQERKKLRRFPRSEQQRRLGIIMRRMEFLNVPIFDFFLDQGVQYITPETQVGAAASVPLIWPSLPSRRKIGSEDTALRDIRYVVLPTTFGAQCVEGVHVVAGDEIRVTIPPARNRRNIVFSVLPLAPSNVRAWIGQYSWARQFNDSEVNRIQSVTIPVSDPVASSLRLSIGSGNMLLTSAAIAQWDRSGRLPVQVGSQSDVWRTANENVAVESDLPQDNVAEDGNEEATATQAAQAGAAGGAAQGGNSSATTQTGKALDNSPGAARQAGSATTTNTPNPANAQSSAAEPETASSAGKPEENKKGKGRGPNPMDELLDPVSVKYNPVLTVDGHKSVALGYNAMLVQLDPILNDVFADKKLFESLAPRLHEFLEDSHNLKVELPVGARSYEVFQHTIVRQNGEFIPMDLPILTKDLISGSGVFNLYQEFRNFGYRVVSFASAKALSLPNALSQGNEIPEIEGRWLDNNDWRFVARRKELDQQNEQLSGLEAIFRDEQSSSVQSMSENDFSKMSEMLEGLERESDAIPDWRANEIAIINDRSQYLPRLVDSYQRWIKDNSQSRFLAHVYLHNDDHSLRPSFKDFLKVLKVSKVKALALPSRTERLSRLVMVDRVFGQMIDALIARRIYHRTAMAVLLPPPTEVEAKKSEGRFMLRVPGLVARQTTPETQLRFDDVAASLAQVVGVQLNSIDNSGRKIFSGVGLEVDSAQTQPVRAQQVNIEPSDSTSISEQVDETEESTVVEKDKPAQISPVSQTASSALVGVPSAGLAQQVSRFRMIVLPRAAGCQPFEWIASSPYFGLKSSQPIIEEPSPRGRVIRIFPCGLRDHVIELSWFQTHAGGSNGSLTAGQIGQWLGGTFKIHLPQSQQDSRDSPLFLVGPQALALDSLPLRLQKFQPDEVRKLFDVNKSLNADRETLARVLNLNSQIQSHQLSARTLVYFFREPVRR